jgi:hypothetical protein
MQYLPPNLPVRPVLWPKPGSLPYRLSEQEEDVKKNTTYCLREQLESNILYLTSQSFGTRFSDWKFFA